MVLVLGVPNLLRGLMAKVNEVPEMHDQLICAAALAQDSAIITKDETLQNSASVQTVW